MCSTPCIWGVVQVADWVSLRVCVCCSCGNKWGLAGPRVLEGARCRCCGTEWSCSIVIVEILHSGEGGDVEQVCSNLETILPCLRLLIALSHLCLYIACTYCSYLLHAWYSLVLHLYECVCVYMLEFVCSHLYSTKRAIVAPQLLI